VPHHTSQERDTKIYVVSNGKGQWTTPLVGIVLLSRHGSLQVRLNTMYDFLGLCDWIKAKGHPLTRFNPVRRCVASVVIEFFERCHLETLLITVVIREFSQWQALVPTVSVVHHIRTEYILKDLVHSLYLTIGPYVIS
jgi:hypothetical protein